MAMLGRSMSLTDTMEARRDAFVSLRALEAEIILLLSIPEETRSKLIGMVCGVREELVAVIESIQSSNRNNNINNNSATLSPSLSSPRKGVIATVGGGGSFPAPSPITPPKPPRTTHRVPKDFKALPSVAPSQSGSTNRVGGRQQGSSNRVVDRRATDTFDIASSPLGLEEGVGASMDYPHSTSQCVTEDSEHMYQSTSFVGDDGGVSMGMQGPRSFVRKSIAATQVPPQSVSADAPRQQDDAKPHNNKNNNNKQVSHIGSAAVVNNTSFSSTVGSGSGPTPPSAQHTTTTMTLPQASYGHCISAAVYMALEYLLIGCQADRLALFTKTARGGGLELAFMVGPGVAPAKRGVMVSPVGLVQAVFSTQIAANLDTVTYEDVAECPGPTTAKNVLAFPVIDVTAEKREVQGVVMLVNKQHGTKPFDASDEHLLHVRLPCLSYILRQYPLEYASFPFDAAPLHRLTPLPMWTPPSLSIPKSLSCAPHPQRVFHRNGAEKFIRRQALTLTDDIVQAPSMADSLWNVEAYIAVLEDCWKRGIADRIEVELTLRQKMQHLSDAREILVRKQKKFDILKETLCEQLEHNVVDTNHSRTRRR